MLLTKIRNTVMDYIHVVDLSIKAELNWTFHFVLQFSYCLDRSHCRNEIKLFEETSLQGKGFVRQRKEFVSSFRGHTNMVYDV